MSKLNTTTQMIKFFTQNKKLWLFPLFIILALLGLLIVTTQGSALAPFLYTLF